jgi:hypothetical protein
VNSGNLLGILFVILLISASVGAGFGLDYKKWWSWLFIFAGFLLGFLMVFSNSGDQKKIPFGLCLGSLFGLFVFIGGWISRRHRKKSL